MFIKISLIESFSSIVRYSNIICEFESRSGEVYSIQHYVLKFVGRSFLRVCRFPPPIRRCNLQKSETKNYNAPEETEIHKFVKKFIVII